MDIVFTECSSEYCARHFVERRILCKLNKEVQGFITVSDDKIFFAFGKPSQHQYIAFYTDSVEKAKERMRKYISNREKAGTGVTAL